LRCVQRADELGARRHRAFQKTVVGFMELGDRRNDGSRISGQASPRFHFDDVKKDISQRIRDPLEQVVREGTGAGFQCDQLLVSEDPDLRLGTRQYASHFIGVANGDMVSLRGWYVEIDDCLVSVERGMTQMNRRVSRSRLRRTHENTSRCPIWTP
jgi:hypothetical protein